MKTYSHRDFPRLRPPAERKVVSARLDMPDYHDLCRIADERRTYPNTLVREIIERAVREEISEKSESEAPPSSIDKLLFDDVKGE